MATNGARVLIVEDDILLGDLYKTRMEITGMIVFYCRDGQEAVDRLVEFTPDLILLDLMMPRLSGFKVIEKVRAMPDIKQPKILVLTALGEPEDRERAVKLGADGYLIKSGVGLDQILAAIEHELAT
ncbi:MAG TPA: response regulator [Candidatus Saccharimonadales bacterium]